MGSRAFNSAVIGLGPFVQVPVQMFKATKVEGIRGKLHTVCSCGESPKQKIECPKCSKTYPSWFAIPDRSFDAGGDTKIILTKEEIDAAKCAHIHDMMQVEKVVDFKAFATSHILTDPVYLLPDDKAVSATMRAYALIVEALASDGMVMLTRLTTRGISKRYAIMGDKNRNILVAYEVEDSQPVPREVTAQKVDEKMLKEAKALLAGSVSTEMDFPADPDALEEIISNKIDENMRKGGLK